MDWARSKLQQSELPLSASLSYRNKIWISARGKSLRHWEWLQSACFKVSRNLLSHFRRSALIHWYQKEHSHSGLQRNEITVGLPNLGVTWRALQENSPKEHRWARHWKKGVFHCFLQNKVQATKSHRPGNTKTEFGQTWSRPGSEQAKTFICNDGSREGLFWGLWFTQNQTTQVYYRAPPIPRSGSHG